MGDIKTAIFAKWLTFTHFSMVRDFFNRISTYKEATADTERIYKKDQNEKRIKGIMMNIEPIEIEENE
jgi:hypothetical protein